MYAIVTPKSQLVLSLSTSVSSHQFLFRSTLRPAAGSATTTFLFAPFALAFNAPPAFAVVVFIAVALFAVTGLLFAVVVLTAALPRFALVTIVVFVDVVLISDADVTLLAALVVRCGDDGADGTGRGGGSILPFAAAAVAAVVAVADFSRDACRLSLPAVVAPRFACSIIPCAAAEMADVAAEAADLRGEAGLRGEIGRAM